MGQSVPFESFRPNRDWTMVQRSKRDGMTGVSRTRERERICSFPAAPLNRERSALSVHAGKLKFSSLKEFVAAAPTFN